MVEASADFHNFEGDESLSRSVSESPLFFPPELLGKFDCHDAPRRVGKTSARSVCTYRGETNDLG